MARNLHETGHASLIHPGAACIDYHTNMSGRTSKEANESSFFSPSAEIDIRIPQWASTRLSCLFHTVMEFVTVNVWVWNNRKYAKHHPDTLYCPYLSHKQPRIRKLPGRDVSCWIWDQRHHKASLLVLTWIYSIGRDVQLHTSIYDKRDDFSFQITNCPFLSTNIESSPAYGVFISQLIPQWGPGVKSRICHPYPQRVVKTTNRGGVSESPYKKVGPVSVLGQAR